MAKAPVVRRQTEAEPRVRRGYFESRYGQLHVLNAIPPGGGFEEGTPLLCLHSGAGSSRLFERFLPLAGRDRSVYAPDTPGLGDSDAPGARASLGDYAAGIADFLESMRFRQIDVLGYQDGSLLAAELAIERPQQVRRVVMVSVPVLDDSEREVFRRTSAPSLPVEDGSHLTAEWRRVRAIYPPGVPLDVPARAFAERLRNGAHGGSLAAAVQQYAARDRLPLVRQPTLVLRVKDEFWDASARAREWLPKAKFVDLPEYGGGVLEAAPQAVRDATRDFLR